MERKDAMYICENCGKKYASKADMYRCMANDLDNEAAMREEEDKKFTSWIKKITAIKDEINAYNEKLPDNRKVYFRAELHGHSKGASISSKFSKTDADKVLEKEQAKCKCCNDEGCKCKSAKKDPFTLNLLNFSDYDHDKFINGVKSARTWRDLGLFDDIRTLMGENFSDEELTKMFNKAMKDPEISKLADDLQKKKKEKEDADDWAEFFNEWLKEEEER